MAAGQQVFSNRYEVVRGIGRGGMAEVYLAHDRHLDRPVAVKVLTSALSRDPTFVERFRREAQAAANLNHPNIVAVYDWGQEDGTYFIVMEYVDGHTLRDVLRAQTTLEPSRRRRHRRRDRRRALVRAQGRRRAPRREARQRAHRRRAAR